MTDLPTARPPTTTPTPPVAPLPPGACDAHVHMVADDYRLWHKRVENPAPGGFEDWITRLEAHLDQLGFERVVVVHSILYGGDNAVTRDSVARLGRYRARGIGLVTDAATDAELDALADAGVSGIRLNYVHGGLLSWEGVQALGPRLAERGLHVQMLIHTHRHMLEIADAVRELPVPVVFDHIGWPELNLGVQEPGFDCLRGLVGDGRAYAKLSGLYRLEGAPYAMAAEFAHALVTASPDHCLWGSDWPHIMLAEAAQPDAGQLLNRFLDTVTSAEQRRRILADAPARLYGF